VGFGLSLTHSLTHSLTLEHTLSLSRYVGDSISSLDL